MAAVSHQITLRPHRWHVQQDGPPDAPLLLLIHGAGGATQTWRHVFPLLICAGYRVVAMDLPGQGYTRCGARHRCGLDAMAQDLAALAESEGWSPAAVVGHSAGGALALRLAELPAFSGCGVVVVNAALARFDGVAGWLFPQLARALAVAPGVSQIFAATASTPSRVRKLVANTGSDLSDDDLRFFRRLVADSDHVDGTLTMMSQWSVDGLVDRLPANPARVLFIVADGDKAVPPRVSLDAAARLTRSSIQRMPGGHLVHEEAPQAVVDRIRAFLA